VSGAGLDRERITVRSSTTAIGRGLKPLMLELTPEPDYAVQWARYWW
ncbi:hypothetical protein A2U01_0054910, partial [Trifolium medium]|nr:hypothetical protein [Trifolium medium]